MTDDRLSEERPVAPDHTCTLAIEELVSLTSDEEWEDAEAEDVHVQAAPPSC